MVETDFRALYSSVLPEPMILPEEHGANPPSTEFSSEVTFRVDGDMATLTEGHRKLTIPGLPKGLSGYLGLFAWGDRVEIDSVVLEGKPDSSWFAAECERQALIARAESSPGSPARWVPILEFEKGFPWPWRGEKSPTRGREGRVEIHASGDEAFCMDVGQETWTDYALDGWLLLEAGGTARFQGRCAFRRLGAESTLVSLSEGWVRVGGPSDEGNAGTEIECPDLTRGRATRFRIEWYEDGVQVELEGRQVLRTRMPGPRSGGIRMSLTGEGSRIGGLQMKLLTAPGTSP
ncbi:MAG: hypothetical protein HYU36_18700 [Planctomycetes bacterium]|nr:hypothetical protein [Planctomycetota bacterium]